jgi:hypothetical protein
MGRCVRQLSRPTALDSTRQAVCILVSAILFLICVCAGDGEVYIWDVGSRRVMSVCGVDVV